MLVFIFSPKQQYLLLISFMCWRGTIIPMLSFSEEFCNIFQSLNQVASLTHQNFASSNIWIPSSWGRIPESSFRWKPGQGLGEGVSKSLCICLFSPSSRISSLWGPYSGLRWAQQEQMTKVSQAAGPVLSTSPASLHPGPASFIHLLPSPAYLTPHAVPFSQWGEGG